MTDCRLPRYFELRRRAIELVDSVSQTTCRHCIDPCCERRLCMDAYHKFESILDLEPKAEAIRRAAAKESARYPFIDRDGCLYTVLRPTVCLSFYCDQALMGLLRTERLCVLAMGRAFPDQEVTGAGELRFLEHALDVCTRVLVDGEPLPRAEKRALITRIPGLNERMSLYVVAGGRARIDVDDL